MEEKIAKLPRIADPTIDRVFEEFLAEQRERVKPKTWRKYKDIIDLLRHHLNGYGHDVLSKAESALFKKYYSLEGDEHRDFCQLFGPEHVTDNFGMFLNYFMIRKVMAGVKLARAAGTVTKKLAKWLVEKGYASDESVERGLESATEAIRDLPNAERAGEALFEASDRLAVDLNSLADEDYVDFDHFTITKIEPGKLWLEAVADDEPWGSIPVPKKATSLLQEGWDISCSLGRIRGTWRILEMANVYPN